MCNDVARCFGRSAATYDAAADVQRRVAMRLSELASPYICKGGTVFEFGCGTGFLTCQIASLSCPSSFYLNDVSADMQAVAKSKLAAVCDECQITDMVGDAESMSWPAADAIVSASAVQWFYSPLSAVRRASDSLRIGGIFAIATYGPLTFRELRSGEPCAYPSAQEWEDEFQRHGFEMLASETSVFTQFFASRMALLRMVARTGVGARGEKQSASALHGECRLTWQPVMFVARLLG